jgi:hypothetical protein
VDQDSARGVPDPIGLHNGLLNANSPLGNLRVFSQIFPFVSFSDQATWLLFGFPGPVLAARRDNFRDSPAIEVVYEF